MCNNVIRSFDCSDSSFPCEIFPGTDIYQWNAVDVKNSDGLLERGVVINTLRRGLLVDFGVPGRRAQVVDLKRAQHCLSSRQQRSAPFSDWDEEFKNWQNTPSSPANFQVLARTAADRPWTWYRAVFLVRRVLWSKYAYIRVQFGQSFVNMYASALMVRRMPRDWGATHRVRVEDYVVRVCTLPPEYTARLPVDPALWNLWMEMLISLPGCAAYPTCVQNGSLLYLQNSGGPAKPTPLSEGDLNRVCELAKAEKMRRLQAGWTFNDDQWIPPENQLGISSEPPILTAAFPPELMREILSCFGMNERPFYRRVSPLWDAIMKQDDDRQRLTLTFDDAGTAGCSGAMGIIKYLTAATEVVVITNARQSMMLQELGDCLRLISAVVQQHGNRQRKLQVVFHRCRWELGDDRLPAEVRLLAKTWAEAEAAVERIVWRNCRLCGIGDEQNECVVVSDVTTYPDMGWNLRTDLYALLERHLLWPEHRIPLNIDGLGRWIAKEARLNVASDNCATIKRILETYQSNDPRPTNRYRGKPGWSGQDLRQLDIKTLSTLTLWVLHLTMLSQAQFNLRPFHRRPIVRSTERLPTTR
ncbi:uncharacterized protein LOC129586013 [Paramacrobiotus metropolitanus]|uniref:uncharacterized protein LOC129586013 n=1 Tax=Paramacrobiotus metropolitanus TaxID=2943436 RepID=UPI002446329F|nr:uncharacterized protein LOC129586013 [Paramacrobiotus metropolitanus]XP_055334968.1 uncharacterized protein LOC129586013 [Paramacrobiotus metropolitanus]